MDVPIFLFMLGQTHFCDICFNITKQNLSVFQERTKVKIGVFDPIQPNFVSLHFKMVSLRKALATAADPHGRDEVTSPRYRHWGHQPTEHHRCGVAALRPL